jgi:pilus assembly protein Flp/PilA
MNVCRVLVKLARCLRADRRAATAVEYGLIISLIVIAMVTALVALADASTSVWNNVSDKITRAG